MSESLLPSLPVSNLKRYLLKQGWSRIDHPNNRIEILKTTEDTSGDYASVAIPTSNDFSNSEAMINEAIKILAAYENKPFVDLFNRLRRWGNDTLLARLFKIQGNEDSLPLSVAAETISRFRDFVGYAAYTQSEPRPFFDKAGGVSTAFSNLCRFGHTFQGSFGLTIECPITVTPVLPLDGNHPEIPFERQVFERIASGLSILRSAISEDSLDPMIQGYHTGFSANMCRALTEAYEQVEGRRIEYNILWNPELQSSVEANWQPFLFEGRAYEFTRAAAVELEKSEVFPDSLVEGTVVALKSDKPPGLDQQQEFEHVITMFWEREKGQLVRIRIPLVPQEYMKACDAHKDGKRIRIYGVPEKSGKYWTLTKSHDFTVLL
jgi:hypothetical protein